MGNHAQIVGHHQVGQVRLTLKFRQQVEDFRLNRDVQRRGRFIQQQHLRLQNQRPGNRHALALPAGKLVRIAIAKRPAKPNFIQQGVNAPLPIFYAVNVQRLFQNIADGVTRMQRAVRILKYHLHPAAAFLADTFFQPLAVNRQLALPVGKQPGKAFQHRGFARTGLPHQAVNLAVPHADIHIVQHLITLLALAKRQVKVLYLDHLCSLLVEPAGLTL